MYKILSNVTFGRSDITLPHQVADEIAGKLCLNDTFMLTDHSIQHSSATLMQYALPTTVYMGVFILSEIIICVADTLFTYFSKDAIRNNVVDL